MNTTMFMTEAEVRQKRDSKEIGISAVRAGTDCRRA